MQGELRFLENPYPPMELVPVAEGSRILPEDAREYARQIQALPETEKKRLLPRALLAGLQRFRATRSMLSLPVSR